MVHDVILTLLRNKTLTESIESICVTHQLDPLITESIMQVVRENQFPVDEQCTVFHGCCLPEVTIDSAPFR